MSEWVSDKVTYWAVLDSWKYNLLFNTISFDNVFISEYAVQDYYGSCKTGYKFSWSGGRCELEWSRCRNGGRPINFAILGGLSCCCRCCSGGWCSAHTVEWECRSDAGWQSSFDVEGTKMIEDTSEEEDGTEDKGGQISVVDGEDLNQTAKVEKDLDHQEGTEAESLE